MLKTQAKAQSNNPDPCGKKGEQRPPPCPPLQQHGIEPDAPRAALRPGERGWGSPPQPEQRPKERRGPQIAGLARRKAAILEPHQDRAGTTTREHCGVPRKPQPSPWMRAPHPPP